MSADRVVTWALRLFIVVGVGLIVVGLVLTALTARFVSNADSATGTVVDLSRERDSEGAILFYPVVRFTTADGRTVEFRSSSGSGSPPQPGDMVEVLYEPDDPGDARLGGFTEIWSAPLIVGGIGLVMLGVALVVRRLARPLSKKDADWLRLHGTRLEGRSPRVVRNETLVVAGSTPFRVEVDVDDPAGGGVRILTSENIWFDPSSYLGDRDTLDAYVDPRRPERYLVDLSFLPKRAD